MFILFSSVAVLAVTFLAVGMLISAPSHNGPATDHFDGKKFINPGNVAAKGFGDVMQWMINRKQGPWTEDLDENYGTKPDEKVHEGVKITFVNHSTFLIQANGLNILTDPVWSERTSPFQFIGPKRMRQPGIRFEDLPKIDYIILSHNHYDHLDIGTLKNLYRDHTPKIITPLGVKSYLANNEIHSASDLDWWQEFAVSDSISIQSVPAQHFSGRGFSDRDATLWCGYVIKRPGGNIYFAGDTGYNNITFKEIGTRCAPVSVALIPIGAYKPQWFMSPIHCSPAEAVQIHFDLNATQSIATHFGTFALADDGEEEPIKDLQQALQKFQLSTEKFLVLKEGEGKVFINN
jgi:L-ascorbate metabolism protein UlaG (beta-lactamase superfamily)